MPWPTLRIALAALLLPGLAAAQERSRPRPEPTPTVKPRPGPAATKPKPEPAAKPVAKPGAKPGAKPAPKPVPAPAALPPPVPEPEKPAEPAKGSATGAPLPRFAALRSDEVNLRTGPGTRYPIEWLYKRRDLPVQIEREFETWRLIRDQEGVKGWVNQATLVPRRTGVVIGGDHVLRAAAGDDAAPVARLKPGVILRIRGCEAGADWCQASVQDYRGWIRRTEFWGTFPGEAVQ